MKDFEELIGLARQNVDEGWRKIDSLLPQYVDEQACFDWAKTNTGNPDSGLRDLAASILEQTTLKFDSAVIDGLFALMGQTDEKNPYPSFRASCALARRCDDPKIAMRLGEVRSNLQKFVEDESVLKTAQDYLSKLDS